MAIKILSILSVYLFLFTGHAFAGRWDNKCSAAGKSSQATCQAEVAKLKGAEAGRSSVRGKNDARGNAERLAADATAQSSDSAKAKTACEAAKTKCESACTAAKGEAQPIAKNPKHPQQKEAAADVAKIDSTKASECTTPLTSMISQLGAGQANTAADSNAADKTKEAADGKSKENAAGSSGMPQMPQMPQSGGDDKGEEQQPQQQVVNNLPTTLSCKSEDESRYSDCNKEFTGKCLTAPATPGCESFNSRYCNHVASAGSVDSSNANPNFAHFVKDKQGEGLGSEYCQRVVATKFCAGGNKSNCPSCRAMTGPWHGMGTVGLDQARQTCPDDPLFLNPKNTKAASTQSQTSSMATASVEPQRTKTSLNDEALLESPKQIAEEAEQKDISIEVQSASAIKVASANEDIADQYGPSVFSILGTTYRDLCLNKRVNCK